MNMKYPDKKQIKRKTEELARLIRLYIMNIAPPSMVRNGFNCLFTDLFLEISNNDDEQAVHGHFDTLLKGMASNK